MNDNRINAILVIGGGVFAIAAIVLLLISMFGTEAPWMLPTALGLVVAGFAMNIAYRVKNRKKQP